LGYPAVASVVPQNDRRTNGRWWEFLSREKVEKMAARARNWDCIIAPNHVNIRIFVLICQGFASECNSIYS
jgi:hypothetical protein